MKKVSAFLFVMAGLAWMQPSETQARASISIDFFYDNLDPYGDWREVGDYGYVWQPRGVAPDWSPYSDGRWVYTDAGWTWDSEEPYGWAVYHYGRWANVENVGWIWVPGTEWAPAWVSWRHSPSHVGWAPLPPEARFSVSIGFSTWVDDYYDIGPGHYRFVESRNFGNRRLNTVFIDRRENITIINQTTNITNIRFKDNVIHNDGPDYDFLARQSNDRIDRYKLNRRQDLDRGDNRPEGNRLGSRIEGDTYSVPAPSFLEGPTKAKPRKPAESVQKAEINRGWKNAGPPDEIRKLRTMIKEGVQPPKDLPPKPIFEKHTESAVPASTPVTGSNENERRGGEDRRALPPAQEAGAKPPKIEEPRNVKPEQSSRPKVTEEPVNERPNLENRGGTKPPMPIVSEPEFKVMPQISNTPAEGNSKPDVRQKRNKAPGPQQNAPEATAKKAEREPSAGKAAPQSAAPQPERIKLQKPNQQQQNPAVAKPNMPDQTAKAPGPAGTPVAEEEKGKGKKRSDQNSN